tara:strand:- start:44 stop:577 length:534 start_codon:yes stop_codon:yes gene_type:complete
MITRLNNNSISSISALPSGIDTGKILQVVNQFYDTQTSTTGTSFVDTGLTANITPSSTSNKILASFYPSISGEDNSYVAFKMFRDSTEIGSSTVTGTGEECFAGFSFANAGNLTYSTLTFPLVHLDSPSTTSQITYKLQFSPMRTTSKSCILNRSYNLGDNNQFRTSSRLILMEVQA